MSFLKNIALGIITLLIVIVLLLIRQGGENGKHLINGREVPEIMIPDISGKPVALSSFKGNIVLIDFWASWCKPCRKNNPKILRVYNQYKGKTLPNGGKLVVYAVSLDSKKESWIKAIEDDGLLWDAHVSHLTGWQSEAVEKFDIQ
jgi:thiol-disulfide isomerase/thioredoxin